MILRTERTKPCLVQRPLKRERMARTAHPTDRKRTAECYAMDGVHFIEYRRAGRVVARQSFFRDQDFLERWKEVLAGSFEEGMGA